MEKMQMWFKEFFPLNYRAICHPDTSLPSNTWICVSYKHGHTQHSWDAAIQSQTLLPCKLQTPFSFYHSPNGALDCEGVQLRAGLVFSCSSSSLASSSAFPKLAGP